MEVLVQTKSMVIRVRVQLDGRVQTVIRVNLISVTFVNICSITVTRILAKGHMIYGSELGPDDVNQ